jgi:peptidoglycan/LPS O-acetylase OafA/YrhL
MSRQTLVSNYRPDIDGLRALAVVPVCFFHAGLPIFPGGFVGVDVFFVISGYLMASMIGQALSDKNFSLIDFYERRIRRIFPALFVVLAFTCCAASFLIPPKMFRDFGYTLVASVLFVSNIAFWQKSENYFDAPTELNPLLHIWSLSVEEQFYIILPLFLAIIWYSGRRVTYVFVACATTASLILSIWGTTNAPTATFYLLPTRAWELLAGALVALWPVGDIAPGKRRIYPSWVNGFGGVLGLALVLWAVICFDAEMAFPGAAALVPCVGAALLIHFGRDGINPATRLLGLAPFRFVGRISYSLYLWHWPLIIFAEKYNLFGHPSFFLKVLIVLISGFVAYASYRWIEQPFRRRNTAQSRIKVFAAAASSMTIVGMVGIFAQTSHGWPERFTGITSVAIEPQLVAENANKDGQKFEVSKCFVDNFPSWGKDLCFLSKYSKNKALLWGDSFAANYAYGLFATKAANFDTLQYTSPRCPPIIGYDAASRPTCAAFNQEVPGIIERYHISTVIMAADWEGYVKRQKMRFEDIRGTIDLLHQFRVRVVLIGQSPVFAFTYPDEYFFKVYGSQSADHPYEAELAVNPKINEAISGVSNADVFFDAMAPLCAGDECVFKDRGLYLFADHGHFTQAGSTRMAASLLNQLARSQDQNRPITGKRAP